MSEPLWINGEITTLSEARISVEDRGFQFADGVYEVIRLYNAKPFTLTQHLDRLQKSAAGIQLALPIEPIKLKDEIQKFIPRTSIRDGMIYLQLTRGAAPRNHVFPQTKPSLLFYVRPLPPIEDVNKSPGAKLLSVPDERWQRCWIKSIALLPNVLAKNQAVAAGADEAVFIDHGNITECSACNVYAISAGRLVTHPVGNKVLPGITRGAILELASKLGIKFEERPWREDEALAADEIFITSTTREITWVEKWNNRTIGRGQCGPVTQKLHAALRKFVAEQCN